MTRIATLLAVLALLIPPVPMATPLPPETPWAAHSGPREPTVRRIEDRGTGAGMNSDHAADVRTRIEGGIVLRHVDTAWALERFEVAGLDLPPLVITVHATRAGCHGRAGEYRRGDTEDSIDICEDAMAILLHELAHAWEAHHASDRARAAFLDHVGLEHWSGSDVPWADRGMERAAMTISHALAERPLSGFEASLCADMLEAYEILTGRESPRLAGLP